MKILIIGTGGREQAIAWKCAQSEAVTKIYIAQGNAGRTSEKCLNIDLDITDASLIRDFVLEKEVSLLIIGPEQPLVNGLVDQLQAFEELNHLHIIGPSAKGAQLEGSKDFAKAFMERHNIPTAKYATFNSHQLESAKKYLRNEVTAPYVIKADGLAAGKGVLIIDSYEQAVREVEAILGGRFGDAGKKVVIEQYLDGIECSVFVLTDGKNYRILPEAKDYKRIGDGDTGLNTGGMGAVSPVPFYTDVFAQKVEEHIIKPTIQALSEEQIPYKGFIFIGLMNVEGEPYVIEYNCRMGDPETEVVMLRIQNDLVPYLLSLKYGQLDATPEIKQSKEIAMTVIIASGGYPEDYQKGLQITGLETFSSYQDVVLFHAGTKLSANKEVVTNGGRVLALSVLASDIQHAKQRAYELIDDVRFDHIYYRHDIGDDLMNSI